MTHSAVRSWRTAARALPLLLVGAVLVTTPGAAQADTAPDPVTPINPGTYSARPLPTVQIGDGVAWSQVVVGNTVYVGGNFSTARPAGSAQGQNTVARSNLLAYDIRNGQLLNSWTPSANGEVQAITASPDGSRIYVGGTFTTINGTTRRRIAALNPTTGALINAFNPNPDARVRAIAATNETVYFGGSFSAAGGMPRTQVAAARASDGAVLTWAPQLNSGAVWSMALSPDGGSVAFGGQFTSVNGSTNPGYGLAKVDAVTGALQPFGNANTAARNGGTNGAITDLHTDGNELYITGYTFGRSGGNLEAIVRVDWDTGNVRWVADCHGDHYSIFTTEEVVYTASHSHYCGNMPDGYHQNAGDNWLFRRGNAYTKAATGVLRTEYYGYSNYAGYESPSILQWYPQQDAGTFTGQGQSSWAIEGNDDYLVMAGEFTRVDGMQQQGLVRYARVGVGGETSRTPQFNGASTNPTVVSPGAGQALVSWEANWDRDNEFLTYRIMRNGNNVTPAHTRVVGSQEQNRPFQSWLDTGLTPGDTVRYRIFATDPLGNEVRSESVETVVAGGNPVDAYAAEVAKSGPKHLWRFGESAGTTAAGFTGLESLTLTGVTNQPDGAIAGNAAATFAGNSTSRAVNQTAVRGSDNFWYSVEAWFRTTTNRGGKIIGYGNQQNSGSSSSQSDRTLYMDNSGRINFGTRQGGNRIITSQSGLNNGQWHHAVGVVGTDGMALYIDGVRVAYTQAWTTGNWHLGFWRIGGDNLSGWGNRPTSDYFAGDLDEVAVYNHALGGDRVRAHYEASGRTVSGPAIPSDAYGEGVYDANPDLYWRLNEAAGTAVNDYARNGRVGTHTNGPTLGAESAIGLGGDTSVSYDGVNDITSTNAITPAPQRSSTQLWFKTDTTTGGRLVGFGDQRLTQSGASANDRVVYMTDQGRLRFGVRSQGTLHTIESSGSYNDDQWHQVVATHGRNGMRLYVDSIEVASGATSGYTDYNGYWKVGGDNLTGWPARPSSDFFRGLVDEVAIYSSVLSPQQITTMFNDGGGETPNVPPEAAFTSAVDKLSVSFNSAGSNDADGTIEEYLWDFGDGASSTQANPTHVYASPGDYDVTLTVTDDRGGEGTVTQPVTAVANVAPVAGFSTAANGLTVAFTSTSTDADGEIASYDWDFGDGASSTQANPVHEFGAEGAYQVELTVTDDEGAQDSVIQEVVVQEAQGPVVQDLFGRTVNNGWGSANIGGVYNTSGADGLYSVSGGQGQISMSTPGTTLRATLPGAGEADADGSVKWSLSALPQGGPAFISLAQRANNSGTQAYRTTVRVDTEGRLRINLTRVDGGETTLSQTLLPVSANYEVGDQIQVRMQTEGTSPTQLRAKLWKVGEAEPAGWQVQASDGTAALQSNRGVGVLTYLSGNATNTPIAARFDDLTVYGPGGGPVELPNVAPVADFTAAPSGLEVAFTSTSSDSDGDIASHDWDFGDGASSTATNPTHTYAAAGTYPVELTVTDDDGAEHSVTKDVTVTEPTGPVVQDLFGRTVNNGWGSANIGGVYNTSGADGLYSVSGGQGQISMANPGTTLRATLPGAGEADADGSVKWSLSALPQGGPAFISLAQRANNSGTQAYRTTVRLDTEGRLRINLTRVDGGETTLSQTLLPVSANYEVGDQIQVRMQTEGTSPTQLRAKLWKVGEAEPAGWQVQASDGTAALQSNRGVGVLTYLSGNATNAPVARFDDLIVGAL